jgi:hypothetical protein
MEEDLKYPVGKFSYGGFGDRVQRAEWIQEIAHLPEKLQAAVSGLNDEQLDTPYRPDGWSVRQLVHHVCDSHVNSYCRFRLALTEAEPIIKPYDEKSWANLPDARELPIDVSLQILAPLHYRWVHLLKCISEDDFARSFVHPEYGPMTLDKAACMYAWHSRHHTAHVVNLRKRMGW